MPRAKSLQSSTIILLYWADAPTNMNPLNGAVADAKAIVKMKSLHFLFTVRLCVKFFPFKQKSLLKQKCGPKPYHTRNITIKSSRKKYCTTTLIVLLAIQPNYILLKRKILLKGLNTHLHATEILKLSFHLSCRALMGDAWGPIYGNIYVLLRNAYHTYFTYFKPYDVQFFTNSRNIAWEIESIYRASARYHFPHIVLLCLSMQKKSGKWARELPTRGKYYLLEM